jgi:hypothetical protein
MDRLVVVIGVGIGPVDQFNDHIGTFYETAHTYYDEFVSS